MILPEKIAEFYGVPSNSLAKGAYPCYGFEYGDKQFYGFIVPNILTGEDVFVFGYDSYVLPRHIETIKSIPGVIWTSPALEFNLVGKTLDTIQNSIKTKKSYFTNVLPDVDTTIIDMNVENTTDTYNLIRQKHPCESYECYDKFFTLNGYRGYITYGSVSGEELYRLMWFYKEKEFIGTAIWTTDNEVLRKKYSPSLAGHFLLVKHALESGIEKVRFSLYYPYKKMFGVEPVMYPSLTPDVLFSMPDVTRMKEFEIDKS